MKHNTILVGTVLLSAFVLFQSACRTENAMACSATPRRVSLIQLIASPEKFHGMNVAVTGYLHIEFESHGLYLSKEDAANGIISNGIWIGGAKNNQVPERVAITNDVYVRVEGTFYHEDGGAGHMGAWESEISGVTFLQPCQP